MTESGHRLRHDCPQCGAAVELEDASRIFACPFCRVRLFIHTQGPAYYFLPPRVQRPGVLIHVPYWRFQGSAFVLDGHGLRHRILDASLLALDTTALPPTLGLRSQALPLSFVQPTTPGVFACPDLDSADFRDRLTRAIPGLGTINGLHISACVGDVLSVVHQPFFQGQEIYDGLSGQSLGPGSLAFSLQDNPGGNVQFTSTLCPQCGWDLIGDPQSLVQTCAHCATAWMAALGGGKRLTPFFAASAEKPARWLPFWTLRVQSPDIPLAAWAEVTHLISLPRVPLPEMDRPFAFRVPAFKIRPELFLNLSVRASLHPFVMQERDALPTVLSAVTLPQDEAVQALPVVLGHMDRTLLPRLHSAGLRLVDVRLDYLPVMERGNEFVQPEMNMAIPKQALRWSAAL